MFVSNSLQPAFVLNSSTFALNRALSSYTFSGQGGALLLGHDSAATLTACSFTNNSALPAEQASPSTFSGLGGAVMAQVHRDSIQFLCCLTELFRLL